MAKIVKLIETKLQYVSMMESCGAEPGSRKHEVLLSEFIPGALSLIRVCRGISAEEAVRLKALIENKLSRSQLEIVMEAVSTKVSLSSPSASQATCEIPCQRCLDLDNYLPKTLWDFFLDSSQNANTQIAKLAEFLPRLGFVRLDEKTYGHAALLATQAHGFEQSRLLECTRVLKDYFKGMNVVSLKLAVGPITYPSDPEELKRDNPILWSQAFGNEPPAGTPWTREHKNLVHQFSACRSTKSGTAQGPNTKGATCVLKRLGNTHQYALPSTFGLQRSPSSSSSGLECLPGFQWIPHAPQPR